MRCKSGQKELICPFNDTWIYCPACERARECLRRIDKIAIIMNMIIIIITAAVVVVIV